jgi:hypothetical protein
MKMRRMLIVPSHVIDRLIFLLIGGFIGFVLGYIVRSVHAIKEEMNVMENKIDRQNLERGTARTDLLTRIGLLLVVCLTAFSAFSSQRNTNSSKDTQDALVRVTICTQQYLEKTITALNERTTYTQEQNEAVVELQTSQAHFLTQILDRTKTPDEHIQELKNYLQSLTNFLMISVKSSHKVAENPFPTSTELQLCMTQGPAPTLKTITSPSPQPSSSAPKKHK